MAENDEKKSKGGRPSKLTKEIQQSVYNYILAGSYAEIAAVATGISKQTYYKWMQRGRQRKGRQYIEFLEAIEEALALSEVSRLARITRLADAGNLQADTFVLERMYPDRWGRKDRLKQEITGEKSGPLEITIRYETEEEAKR